MKRHSARIIPHVSDVLQVPRDRKQNEEIADEHCRDMVLGGFRIESRENPEIEKPRYAGAPGRNNDGVDLVAVATLTTVGYGDVYPVTVGGRVFTFFILLIGLGVVSVPAGLVASALAKARQMEDDAR